MDISFVLVVVVVLLIIASIVRYSGISTKCPACDKWWAIQEVNRTELRREPGMKWVQRTETQIDSTGKTSQIQRQVHIHVMRVTYDGLFRCKECGYSQQKVFVEDLEDW